MHCPYARYFDCIFDILFGLFGEKKIILNLCNLCVLLHIGTQPGLTNTPFHVLSTCIRTCKLSSLRNFSFRIGQKNIVVRQYYTRGSAATLNIITGAMRS